MMMYLIDIIGLVVLAIYCIAGVIVLFIDDDE